jgi:hypothetical protein
MIFGTLELARFRVVSEAAAPVPFIVRFETVMVRGVLTG